MHLIPIQRNDGSGWFFACQNCSKFFIGIGIRSFSDLERVIKLPADVVAELLKQHKDDTPGVAVILIYIGEVRFTVSKVNRYAAGYIVAGIPIEAFDLYFSPETNLLSKTQFIADGCLRFQVWITKNTEIGTGLCQFVFSVVI